MNELNIPKTYQIINTCGEIVNNNLPNKFIIKPTHYSGVYKIIDSNNNNNNLHKICKRFIKKTLNKSYNCWWKYLLHNIIPLVEHHYDLIEPRIILEEYIEDNTEWKFYVINYKIKFVYINYKIDNNEYTFFVDKNFNLLKNLKSYHYKQTKYLFDKISKPHKWNLMINIAEELCYKLSIDSIVRVDLFYSNNNIYFNELTFTPAGGRGKFYPNYWDKKVLTL